MTKPFACSIFFLACAGCVSNAPFSPHYKSKSDPAERLELIKYSASTHRVYTLQEIECIPDDFTTKELLEVLGSDSIVAPEIPFFFVFPRAGFPANSTSEKIKYGFHIWPKSIPREKTDKIEISYISYDPNPAEGDDHPLYDEENPDKTFSNHIIVWPSTQRGRRKPNGIPALSNLSEHTP